MDLLSHVRPDPEILREPRGFMRIIQIVLAIFAFGTISCVRTNSHIVISCRRDQTSNDTDLFDMSVNYSYPFRIRKTADVVLPLCNPDAKVVSGQFDVDFSSSAQFFCFIGVMSFLFLLLLIPGYVFLGSFFNKNSLPAKVDFIVSAVFTVLWFVASTAWADNLTKMTQYMNPENLIDQLSACDPKGQCKPGKPGDMSSLIVSVLFGFLNMGLSGASLWFLFKETDWHKDSNASDDPDVYADPGYQTQEYTTDPTMPTSGSFSGSVGGGAGGSMGGGGGGWSAGLQDNNFSDGNFSNGTDQREYYSSSQTAY